ncbi:hypothetical protein RYX36_010119 [Vicia faba]
MHPTCRPRTAIHSMYCNSPRWPLYGDRTVINDTMEWKFHFNIAGTHSPKTAPNSLCGAKQKPEFVITIMDWCDDGIHLNYTGLCPRFQQELWSLLWNLNTSVEAL